jgi:hypothetical protein
MGWSGRERTPTLGEALLGELLRRSWTTKEAKTDQALRVKRERRLFLFPTWEAGA